ncbi:hypothetical protein DFH06DRAFT_1142521 [Mycena polygramma]|nr:hypothetical protein DFH06DRAFT_1142521 [Mycena polygramma]
MWVMHRALFLIFRSPQMILYLPRLQFNAAITDVRTSAPLGTSAWHVWQRKGIRNAQDGYRKLSIGWLSFPGTQAGVETPPPANFAVTGFLDNFCLGFPKIFLIWKGFRLQPGFLNRII